MIGPAPILSNRISDSALTCVPVFNHPQLDLANLQTPLTTTHPPILVYDIASDGMVTSLMLSLKISGLSTPSIQSTGFQV